MSRVLATILGVLATLVGLLAAGGLALALLFEWNDLRPYLERGAEMAIGREVEIGGDLAVDLGHTTSIRVGDLRLANADWAEDPWMLQVDQLSIEFRPWQTLLGTFAVERIELDGPNLRLVRDRQGRANWTLGGRGGPGGDRPSENEAPARTTIPEIDRLLISGGTLRFRDAISGVDFAGDLGTIEVTDEQGEVRDDLEISGQGTLAGQPFDLEVEAGGLQILRRPEIPYPLSLDVNLDETHLQAEGTIDQPLAVKGFDLDFGLEGPNPGPLLARFDLPRLTTPPYTLSGHLSRKNQLWRLTEASGTVGDSDVAGSIAVDLGREPPLVKADLTSEELDLDDLAGLIGLPPSGELPEAGRDLLPAAEFDPEAWRNLNLDVRFLGDSVQARGVPLQAVLIDADLVDGLLALDPVKADLPVGQVLLFATIDATRTSAVSKVDLRLNGLSLDALLPDFGLTSETAGRLSGRARIRGTGESVEDIAGSADGRLGLTMGGGQIDSLLLEAVSLDLAEAIVLMVGGEEDVETNIRCLVADFEVDQGVFRPQALVLDTADMKITGAGTIDLGAEMLDLVLRPHPKDASLVSATTPIHIEGRLRDPSIGPQTSRLIAKGAAALGLGVALPVVGALIPFIQPGLAENSPCATLLDEARTAASKAP